jgi:hypothetical protein
MRVEIPKMKGIIFEDCCEEEEESDVAKEMTMTKKNRLRRIRDNVGEGDDGECQEDEDNDVNEDGKMEKSASRKELKEKERWWRKS